MWLSFENKQLSYRRDRARCVRCETAIQGHSRSSAVVQIDAAQYDFLLALNSNLTSIFNRSWRITLSLQIYASPLFEMEPEKDGWE